MDFIVFQTYTIYLLLALIMITLCWMSAREKNDWWMIGALVVYSLVFAVRYDVGVDTPAYMKSYLSAANGFLDFNFKRWEPLFRGVSYLLASARVHHSVFFFIWAFLPLFCVFWSLRKFKAVYPYLAFTFMFGAIWLSYANGLRQIMAFGFFALSIPALFNRKLWYFLLCVVLAFLCHKSAAILIFLPLLYFRKKSYFNNRIVQLAALVVSLILMNINFVQQLWQQFDTIIGLFEYNFYEHTSYMKMAKIELGAGFYINLAINIMLIWYSNLTKRTFKGTQVNLIYDLTFIGIILNYTFLRFQLIGRINYYFNGFNYIMGAFTLLALVRRRNPYAFILLASLYIFVFIATLYRMHENTALFRFFWEVYR